MIPRLYLGENLTIKNGKKQLFLRKSDYFFLLLIDQKTLTNGKSVKNVSLGYSDMNLGGDVDIDDAYLED